MSEKMGFKHIFEFYTILYKILQYDIKSHQKIPNIKGGVQEVLKNSNLLRAQFVAVFRGQGKFRIIRNI